MRSINGCDHITSSSTIFQHQSLISSQFLFSSRGRTTRKTISDNSSIGAWNRIPSQMEDKPQCTSSLQDASKSTKVKPRPPKLKNPLESVLQGELEFSSSHRPIGTPPPASLRRSRQSFDLSSTSVCDPMLNTSASSSPTSETSEFFPKINVVNSPETEQESPDSSTAFPHLNELSTAVMATCTEAAITSTTSNHTKRPPIDNQRRSMSVDNNNPIDTTSPKGLTPPQRLVTRDQDGVVFELSGGSHLSNN
ncbi:hypothetical protein CHUAL_005777 [Chamberlinius hualienensis]